MFTSPSSPLFFTKAKVRPIKQPVPIRGHSFPTYCFAEARLCEHNFIWTSGVITTIVTLELVYLKIVEGKEVIPQESCISEVEYELMIQCCTRELSSRPQMTDIRQRLTKLLKNAEGN